MRKGDWTETFVEVSDPFLQQNMMINGCSNELIEETKLKAQIYIQENQEEQLWRQKSRVQWLKARENNTKFFHNSMLQHKHSNRIISIRDTNGNKLGNH